MKNNGQLSGDRDTSFLEADLLGKSQPPRFQGTEPCRSRQHRRRRLIEVLSRHFVAMLGDAPISGSFRQIRIFSGLSRDRRLRWRIA